ncbi:hypothetical protein AMECASPLE_030846 [Ameca splendens]|uniref:Secreted protein n=1 Tax=Ameca splendens TaxID=208324 RepID=A0ABV0YUE4_9TELE
MQQSRARQLSLSLSLSLSLPLLLDCSIDTLLRPSHLNILQRILLITGEFTSVFLHQGYFSNFQQQDFVLNALQTEFHS